MAPRVVRAAQEWFESWQRGDWRAMADATASGFILTRRDQHGGPPLDLETLVQAFPTGPIGPLRLQANGTKVVTQFVLEQEQQGGDDRTGLSSCALLVFTDELVASCDLYFEEEALLVQVIADAMPTLTPELLADTVGAAERREYGGGDPVVEQGDEADSLHVIVSGQAEVVRDGAVAGSLGEGQLFGETGLLAGAPRNATVRAVGLLVTIAVGRDTFARLLTASPETMDHVEAVRRSRTPAALQTDLDAYVKELYGSTTPAPCPFTEAERAELTETNELLVYVPAGLSSNEMCRMWSMRSSVDFEADRLIRYAMANEDHWFIASASGTPELIYKSGVAAVRQYEDEGLHGMDVRRYLAFAATYRLRFGTLPDRAYWTFLLAGRYDRSGVSVMGFDAYDTLSHHGWMRDFKAKFVGSRYAVLAPRIELTPETEDLPRAYRGGGRSGREADMD